MTEPLRPGAILEVEAVALSSRGEGIALLDDSRELHVPGLFPGERGQVRVEALARHRPLAHGRLRALLQASPDRREPPCPRQREREGRCSGCPLMPLTIEAQRQAKRAALTREHDLSPTEVRGGDELGYRWSSKRLVGGRRGALVFGSRDDRGGERLADMRGCLVDHPAIVAVFDDLQTQANALGIAAWRGPGDGDLRYLWAKTDGESVLLTLITGDADSEAARTLGPWALTHPRVAGVAHSVQASEGNAIRGDAPRALGGAQTLTMQLAARAGFHHGLLGTQPPLTVGPLGFLQPNPIVAAMAYDDLLRDCSGELALDLYAGAGATTAALRQRFARVVPCEAYPESAAALGVTPARAEDFLHDWLARGEAIPELVVANPPRAGLGPAVCAALIDLGAPRLHLMSCNPQTLAADLARLQPTYTCVELLGYDTLPQTPHLELVARLHRSAS